MEKEIKCRFCESKNTIKKGFRKTQNRGKIQKYLCRDCRRFFVEDKGFLKMKNNEKKITCALDLFYRGVSTRKVQEHFQTFYPHNSSNVSIYKWIIKYSKMVSKFTNKLNLKVGRYAQTDEIEFHRRVNHNKGSKDGVEKNFFIDSIDPTTKFLLSSEYMKTRDLTSIKAVMGRIKERAENQIKTITTDGWRAYPKAIKKTFGYNREKRKFNVYHIRNVAIKDEGFNYPIERLHNNIRHRTKTFRGFHGSISSANALMKGWEIYYNFITKHQTIKCSPYELACPQLKLTSNNKWLELINLSCS